MTMINKSKHTLNNYEEIHMLSIGKLHSRNMSIIPESLNTCEDRADTEIVNIKLKKRLSTAALPQVS